MWLVDGAGVEVGVDVEAGVWTVWFCCAATWV